MKKLDNNTILVDEEDYLNKFKSLKKKKYIKYILKTNIKNNEELNAFGKAFNYKDLKKRYEYIYDYMCNYLDKNVCVLCDFKDNKCIGNRLKTSVHEKDGCCYFRKDGFCEFFDGKKCVNPNITCKLFMCCAAEKKLGYESVCNNYLLLNFFFNNVQKEILEHSYKKKKEYTIDLLLKNTNSLLFIRK